MKAALKKRWIAALCSGKYQQARNGLRTTQGFCCLGVLCDLIDSTKWHRAEGRDWQYDNRGAYIPSEIREPLGLSDQDENRLACMNDTEKKSFKEIAAYIARRKTL